MSVSQSKTVIYAALAGNTLIAISKSIRRVFIEARGWRAHAEDARSKEED